MTSVGEAALVVVHPGLASTVQDRGRQGWQRFGVPVSGALDRVALAAANTVAGNGPDEAGLECLYQGCELEVRADSVRVAVAGAGASLEIGGGDAGAVARIAALESVTAARGQRIRVRMAGPSISTYLAVEGGFALAPVLGSRSTYARAKLGGIEGRVLRAADVIELALGAATGRGEMKLGEVDLMPATVVRVVAGPQDDHFTAEALEAFVAQPYVVQPASDRMGLRLSGQRLAHKHGADIVSDGIAPGAIQVPGDGLPIVMLADRQTTGGYTKIATVISADLPALGRVGPGATLRFTFVEVEAAEVLAREMAARIAEWRGQLMPAGRAGGGLERLYDANLISGVTGGAACCVEGAR